MDAGGEFVGGLIATLEGVRLAVGAAEVFFVAVFDEDDFAELAKGGDGAAASAFPEGLVAFADGGAEFLARDGGEVGGGDTRALFHAEAAFVETPRGWLAVAHGDVGDDVAVALASGVFLEVVEAQQAAREAGNDTRKLGLEAGAIAARLLNGLGTLGVGDVGAFALEDEVAVFLFLIRVDDEVGAVVRRAALHLHLDADALGLVFVFVNQFRPKLGAHFFLRVGPALRVIRSDVVDALRFAFTGEPGVPVFNRALEESHARVLAEGRATKRLLFATAICLLTSVFFMEPPRACCYQRA